jgi:hypothetical protein
MLGTLASVLGGTFIGLVFWLLTISTTHVNQSQIVLLGAFAGLAGSMVFTFI